MESVTPLGLTAVQVVFSKPVEAASAQLPQNYQISKGVTVTWALLGSDARTVTLVTSPLFGGTYTLTVGKVGDRSNALEQIAASSQTNFNFAPAATPMGTALVRTAAARGQFAMTTAGGDHVPSPGGRIHGASVLGH